MRSGNRSGNRDHRVSETSPYNPFAVRGPRGIWNEDSLPVTPWEDPDQRVVVPSALRRSLTLPVPDVLRWDAEKYRLVVSQHERDLLVTRDLSRRLNDWKYHGEETGEHTGNQRILFQDETWPVVRRQHRAAAGQFQRRDHHRQPTSRVSGESDTGDEERREGREVTLGPSAMFGRLGMPRW